MKLDIFLGETVVHFSAMMEPSNTTTAFIEEFSMEITVGVVIMITVSTIGLFINSSICLIIFSKQALQIPFGILCFNHSLNNLLIISVFAFWCLPMMIVGPHPIFEGSLAMYVGQLAWFFWFTYVWSNLQLAVNRSLAILFPLFYSRVCTQKNTKIICLVMWTFGLLLVIHLNTNQRDCYYTFDDRRFTWNFGDGISSCSNIMHKMDEFNAFFILAVSISLDVITLCKLFSLTKNKMMLRKKSQDIGFFMQSLMMGFSLLIVNLSFHVFTIWWNSPIQYFWLTTVVWVSHHTMDGIIVVLFNEKILQVLMSAILPSSLMRKICTDTSTRNNQILQNTAQGNADKKTFHRANTILYMARLPPLHGAH